MTSPGLLRALCVALICVSACGGDDGVQPSTSSASSGAPVLSGDCTTKAPNGCGGCADLADKAPGLACGAGKFWVCEGPEVTKCAEGDGPPVTGLVASVNEAAAVRLAWAPPPGRPAQGYLVVRDGKEAGESVLASFEDRGATAAPNLPPSNLQASDGEVADKVVVRWSAPPVTPGPEHKYQVYALYKQGQGLVRGLPSNEAGGRRAPWPVERYEVSRDGGRWAPAGTGTSYDDFEAPSAITGLDDFDAKALNPHGVVMLTSRANAQTPTPSVYSVRAVTKVGVFEADKVDRGFRRGGQVSVQWQRSAADADAAYADLPGVTGASWFDDSGPADGAARFYRAKLTIDSAPFLSKGIRVPGAFKFADAALWADYGCAARLDAGVYCWGSENDGRVAGAPTTGKFTKVVVGSNHACALKDDKTVVCWGDQSTAADKRRSRIPPEVGTNVLDLAAASETTCVVRKGSDLFCWAGNPPSNPGLSLSSPAGSSYAKVFGNTHYGFCAIETTGATRCWGSNSQGAIVQPPPGVLFKTIGMALAHNCGIDTQDKLRCWGPNSSGRAPPGPSVASYTSVVRGGDHSCARRVDGAIECFGPSSDEMFIGISGEKYAQVVPGYQSACGLLVGGRLHCQQTNRAVAPRLPPTETFKSISRGGRGNVCAIASDDRRWCWGTSTPSDAPRGGSTERFKVVRQGSVGGCGILLDDSLVCWGAITSAAPVQRRAPLSPTTEKYKAVAVAPGRAQYAVCAIRTDGKLLCWGRNDGGEAPPGPSVGTYKAVATQTRTTCAIKADDTIECFGANEFGARDTRPTGAFKEIYAGGKGHFCALSLANKLSCWGDNGRGVLEATPLADEFVSAGVSTRAGCGVRKNDGRRVCWGQDLSGMAPSAPSLDSWLEVAPGSQVPQTSCGIRADGHLLCWGSQQQRLPMLPLVTP